jgi:raffinose/stachyose/melibiose transport system substrate-binding protein
MIRPRVTVGALALALALALAGCGTADQRVKLDFFQFKGEANTEFEALVDKFETEYPDIDVVLNEVPDADTAIRTLLVKGRTPDVLTLNGSGNFGLLAQAGVFHDFTGDPLLDDINPATVEIMQALGTYGGTEINSLPYWSNADGIIYNRQIFTAHNIQAPTTWDELLAACQKLQQAGVTPFHGTLADAWTALPSFNGLGAYATQDGFFDQLRAQGGQTDANTEVSFSADFREVLERQWQLFQFSDPSYRGQTYDDGNAAFAAGQTAMLLQGIWALAPIRVLNPDIDAGVFPYPTDSAADRRLVSGVDVTITIGRDTPRLAEAKLFVDFLFRPDNLEWIAAHQNMFSARADSPGSLDPALAELQPFFEAGQVTGFIDHQFPPSVPLQQVDQQFLFDGDATAALTTLDKEWSKVAARQTGGRS